MLALLFKVEHWRVFRTCIRDLVMPVAQCMPGGWEYVVMGDRGTSLQMCRPRGGVCSTGEVNGGWL
jgi:hypothetical protein